MGFAEQLTELQIWPEPNRGHMRGHEEEGDEGDLGGGSERRARGGPREGGKDLSEEVEKGMDADLSSDLLAIDVREALHHLGLISGAVTTDDLLGNIFANFCIGK